MALSSHRHPHTASTDHVTVGIALGSAMIAVVRCEQNTSSRSSGSPPRRWRSQGTQRREPDRHTDTLTENSGQFSWRGRMPASIPNATQASAGRRFAKSRNGFNSVAARGFHVPPTVCDSGPRTPSPGSGPGRPCDTGRMSRRYAPLPKKCGLALATRRASL
jgi:hypothetical protein